MKKLSKLAFLSLLLVATLAAVMLRNGTATAEYYDQVNTLRWVSGSALKWIMNLGTSDEFLVRSASGTIRLVMDTGGKVGLGGVTAPATSATLDVVGQVRVASAATSGYGTGFVGAYATCPSGIPEGRLCYDMTNHYLSMSTATTGGSGTGWLGAWTPY